MELRYSKTREVKSPTRGTELSAGIDFFVPEYNQDFIDALQAKNHPDMYYATAQSIVVKPHCRILIPSGIKVQVLQNTALIAYNKSGVATKKGLDVMACVVDEDYQGEIHISLLNTTDSYVELAYGEKAVQFIEEVILKSTPKEVPLEELYSGVSERGEGGFGSTGVK